MLRMLHPIRYVEKRRIREVHASHAVPPGGTPIEVSSPTQGWPSFVGHSPWALRISPREAGLWKRTGGIGIRHLASGNWHPPSSFELWRKGPALVTCNLSLATCHLPLVTCHWYRVLQRTWKPLLCECLRQLICLTIVLWPGYKSSFKIRAM